MADTSAARQVASATLDELRKLIREEVQGVLFALAPPGRADVDFVSIDEAARRLGLGRTTVKNMVGDGRLPSQKAGNRRLIRVSDLSLGLTDGGPKRRTTGERRVPRVDGKAVAAAIRAGGRRRKA